VSFPPVGNLSEKKDCGRAAMTVGAQFIEPFRITMEEKGSSFARKKAGPDESPPAKDQNDR
jgi:hypothetical protein